MNRSQDHHAEEAR
jgi:hypothetical protein